MHDLQLQELVILRGLQGLIEDKALKTVAITNNVDVLYDFYEARNMAEQVFAIGRGWA